jgi:hypothetical protein
MKRFFQSGGAFMLVALICIATGLLSGKPALGAVGVIWLILAIAVRAKSAKGRGSTPEAQKKDDAS